MEQALSTLVSEKNEMVKKGQIVEATDRFFAPMAQTLDFDGTSTSNKDQMLEKMKQFAGSIGSVNGIEQHHSSLSGNVSFSEFTFDFVMKDGSHILWHEIIRSVWENGLIVEEQYFKTY